MGVAFADYDGDGRPDVFVTNDSEPNFLFHNEGNGRFTEVAGRAGVAFNDDGRAVSSMGVDFRDIDNDGRPDLFITALVNETYPVYRNLGKGLFADVTYRTRVGTATLRTTGWGNGIFDFNNDGRKDLFSANGDLNDNAEALSGRASRQVNLVLTQRENGTFDAVAVGPAARYRGAAFADFDNDGRIDVVVSRLGERPLLLRNTSARDNHWIGITLVGRSSNRDGIGALVPPEDADRRAVESGDDVGLATRALGVTCESISALAPPPAPRWKSDGRAESYSRPEKSRQIAISDGSRALT